MKVSREQVAENRRKIISVSSRLFRERGIRGVNVAEIMDAAGLTHGAFYGYFKSKDELVASALTETLAASDSVVDTGRSKYVDYYLSPDHRDNAGEGCTFAALAIEASRETGGVREVLTESLKTQLDRLSQTGTGTSGQRRRTAIADWSAMVGSVILARLVADPALSEEILASTHKALMSRQPADKNSR